MCCVSVRWWLTKPISTLFHVNMEFFGILSHITNIDWETTAHETRKKCYKRRKTIRQLFIFVIWNSSFKKRFQRAVFVVFFCSTHEKKKKIVWNKRNVKLYQMAQSVFLFHWVDSHTLGVRVHFHVRVNNMWLSCHSANVQMRTRNSKVGSHSIVWVWCVHLPSRTHAKYLVFFTQNWILIRRKQMVCLKFMTIYSAFSQL